MCFVLMKITDPNSCAKYNVKPVYGSEVIGKKKK